MNAHAAVVVAFALLPQVLRAASDASSACPSPSPTPEFTIVAIGDTGEVNRTQYRNAKGVYAAIRKDSQANAVVFLGDNFYKHGLSDASAGGRDRAFEEVYRFFRPSFTALGNEKGVTPWERTKHRGPLRDEGKAPCGRVHTLAGNHDYYSEAASKDAFRFHALLPLGFSTSGNEYESTRKEWTYHYGEPGYAFWPLEGEGPRKGIYAIFLDSTILVRGPSPVGDDEAAFARPDSRCWNSRPAQGKGEWQDCLSKPFRDRVSERLIELLKDARAREAWTVVFAHHPLHTVGAHGGAVWRPTSSGKEGEIRTENLCSRAHHPLDELKNRIDPEDECSGGWRLYRELVLDAIAAVPAERRASAQRSVVDAFVGGHDHSLQLLSCESGEHRPPGPHPACPRLHIVSGAGARTSAVAPSRPESGVYTAHRDRAKGESEAGWVRLRFTPEQMSVAFTSAGGSSLNQRMGLAASPLVIEAEPAVR